MDWPAQPIESIPPREFEPPHCPWSSCVAREATRGGFRYHRHGVFIRGGDRRVVPRFRCLHCRRTFSLQTFAFSYYLKRPDLAVPVAAGLNAGSAHRQLGRSLGCAPSTVTRLSARLGRHALLLSAAAIDHLGPMSETIVFDHFETFTGAQDHALALGTAVGHRSWFLYGLEPAPHRRSGRRSPVQKARQKKVAGPERGAYGRSFRLLVDELVRRSRGPLTLISDGHPSYRRALAISGSLRRVEHRVHRNPPRGPKGSPRSQAAIDRDRAMFPVDLLHGLMRHTCAHHRRETIAFGRRVNAVVERAYLLMVWRNFVKRRSERRRGAATPAMDLGLTDRPWDWQRVLARRCFPFNQAMVPRLRKVYVRAWPSVGVGPTRPHALRHAF